MSQTFAQTFAQTFEGLETSPSLAGSSVTTSWVQHFLVLSRATSYLMGGLILVLTITVIVTSRSIGDIALWGERVLGGAFIGLMAALTLLSIYSWVRMEQTCGTAAAKSWLEAGLQAAGGITTVALTYTLLGISLGIGSLSDQVLTPDTVQDIIKALTAQFSLAFMTTVIGLPLSTVLRALLMIAAARQNNK